MADAFSTGPARRLRLATVRLYLVTDDTTPAARLPAVIQAAVAGGVDAVQLRRKGVRWQELVPLAQACRAAAHAGGALFFINDHVELALAVDADGVHLGQEDHPLASARARLGAARLLGASTHAAVEVPPALAAGVDYVAAGPVHTTPTKAGRAAVGLGYVTEAAALATCPVVAIGGLHAGNAAATVAAGADAVAVVRAICAAAEPGVAAAALRRVILAASATGVAAG
ncbi:MAG TPA: thiamine phosphate synthase [Candidatus Dormibacteraeota bacterium]|nr:thiamine phosphate synthase [Candidatus Dormibacteraeota bacterium]